jgi:thioesterase domain-containing protein
MLLEDVFAIDVPLASLYEHSTPAKLAVFIAQLQLERCSKPAESEAGSLLVEIKRGAATPPLFLLAGFTGGMAELTRFGKMMSHVRCDYPVYGFVGGNVDGQESVDRSVEATAEAYLVALRHRQPHGPYALAGECVGGLIAFEMAQRLITQGEEIALLLLLDTWCPTVAGALRYHYGGRYVEQLRSLVAARCAIARDGIGDLSGVLRDLIRDRPPFGPLRYTMHATRTLLRVARPWIAAVLNYKPYVWRKHARLTAWLAGARLGVADMGRALRDHVRNRPPFGLLRSLRYALSALGILLRIARTWMNQVGKLNEDKSTAIIEHYMHYRPRRYPGPVTLIMCEDSERQGMAKPWRSLARQGLVTRLVPGSHRTYLHAMAQSVASIVENCLNESLQTSPSHMSTRKEHT